MTGCTRHDDEVQLLGLDLLELDGTDLRREPLMHRKATLASRLRRSHHGIQMVEHIEADDGRTVFEYACKLGLEGIVSKRRDMPYQHGRSRAWLKVKNPDSPAILLVCAFVTFAIAYYYGTIELGSGLIDRAKR